MSSYVSQPNHSENLVVLFEDLAPPPEVGRVSEQPLLLFPHHALDAAVDCGLLLNREMIDIFQRNLNASFGLLRRLAEARSLSEIVELQTTHLTNQLAALIGQIEELVTLSVRTMIDVLRRNREF
jgi:hypothetical protein